MSHAWEQTVYCYHTFLRSTAYLLASCNFHNCVLTLPMMYILAMLDSHPMHTILLNRSKMAMLRPSIIPLKLGFWLIYSLDWFIPMSLMVYVINDELLRMKLALYARTENR